jgi:hypothetical protein
MQDGTGYGFSWEEVFRMPFTVYLHFCAKFKAHVERQGKIVNPVPPADSTTKTNFPKYKGLPHTTSLPPGIKRK